MKAATRIAAVLFVLSTLAVLMFATRASSDPPPAPSSGCVIVINGLPGESTTVPDGIDLFSFGWGIENSPSRHSERGRVEFNDLTITKKLDKSSPKLLLASAEGQRLPSATLTARKDGAQDPYLTVTLSDVLVSSYQTAGSCMDGGVPTDQVSFNYTKIDWTYRQQGADGGFVGNPVRTCWDVRAHRPCESPPG
jgi:type VI secretion system secreted protein Hcp